MDSALRHVRDLGAAHQSKIVDAMCAIYCWHHGDAPSLAELYALFGAMKGLFAEEAKVEDYSAFDSEELSEAETESEAETDSADVSECESYDPSEDSFDYAIDAKSEVDGESVATETTVELFGDEFVVRGVSIGVSEAVPESAFTSAESDAELGEEMDSALAHVRELAKLHQEAFVNSICDLYHDSNGGVEASRDQIFGIFDFIKQEMAIEAREELDEEDTQDEESEDEADICESESESEAELSYESESEA